MAKKWDLRERTLDFSVAIQILRTLPRTDEVATSLVSSGGLVLGCAIVQCDEHNPMQSL